MRDNATLISVRHHRKGTLVGFACVQFPSGLRIGEIQIHVAGRKCWAAPPARPWLTDDDSELVRDPDGRPRWNSKLVWFASHGDRRRWSQQVIDAVRAAKPGLLPDADGEPELVFPDDGEDAA